MIEPEKQVDEPARAVIGAAIEVHRHLGPGFLESIYEEALCLELMRAGITVERQKEVGVIYKDQVIGKHRLDLLVGGRLIVELKTVGELAAIHKSVSENFGARVSPPAARGWRETGGMILERVGLRSAAAEPAALLFQTRSKAQVISCLKAMRLSLGLLINFNVPVLKDGVQRVVYSG